MSIAVITFELDEHTIQLVNGDMLIWINGESSHFVKEADLVITIEDMRRVLDAAHMLRKQP